MTTRSNNARYSSASITMHWAMVLLFIVVYVLVNLADGFEKGSAQRQSARDWHATFGLLIFALGRPADSDGPRNTGRPMGVATSFGGP